jgi:hypothetical protein
MLLPHKTLVKSYFFPETFVMKIQRTGKPENHERTELVLRNVLCVPGVHVLLDPLEQRQDRVGGRQPLVGAGLDQVVRHNSEGECHS